MTSAATPFFVDGSRSVLKDVNLLGVAENYMKIELIHDHVNVNKAYCVASHYDYLLLTIYLLLSITTGNAF